MGQELQVAVGDVAQGQIPLKLVCDVAAAPVVERLLFAEGVLAYSRQAADLGELVVGNLPIHLPKCLPNRAFHRIRGKGDRQWGGRDLVPLLWRLR